jgi:hypothetical protein
MLGGNGWVAASGAPVEAVSAYALLSAVERQTVCRIALAGGATRPYGLTNSNPGFPCSVCGATYG